MPPAEPTAPDDLVIAIEPDGSGGLRLRVVQPLGGGEAPFRSPFSREEVRRLLPALERRVRHFQATEQPLPWEESGLSPQDIGRRLFESLAVGDVARSLFTALGRVREGDASGLRLRLVMDPGDSTVAEVAALPWELLFDPRHHGFLARSPDTPLVRVLPVSTARRLRPGHLPLRVLVAYANPRDTESLDTEEEAREIRDALIALDDRVRVEVTEATGPGALLGRLRDGGFHVLHFIGHGDFDASSGQGRLLFGGTTKPANAVSGRTLASMLQGLADLRLVVLNACDTARFERREGLDPYSGVAPALVRGGLPAVVAMQLPISDRAAIAFSGALYQALADGRPVDLAVARGRQAIRAEQEYEDFEWAAPSLFLQVPDGRILDLRPPPRVGRKDLLRAAAMLLGAVVVYGLWQWIDPGFPYRAWLSPPECPSPAALGREAAMRFALLELASGEFLCVGQFEVTQKQWNRVMGEDSNESPVTAPDLPVTKVTLADARSFVEALNAQEGRRVYRLPTEDEWEWVARAGTSTAYSFGDRPEDLVRYGNCLSRTELVGDGLERPAEVGSFRPNPWGLYDIHGNVWEWVEDPRPIPFKLEDLSKEKQIRRGGGFASSPERCETLHRSAYNPEWRSQETGLRIVREPHRPESE